MKRKFSYGYTRAYLNASNHFILNACTLQINKESVEGEGVLHAIKEVEPRNEGFLENDEHASQFC